MTWANGRQSPDPVTSEHWSRGGYAGHNGIDTINHDEDYNWSVFAILVLFALYNGTAGNEVRGRVACAHGCTFRVLHGATGTFQVGAGQSVGERRRLVRTGNTGQSTGKHCHTEFWWAGNSNDRTEPRAWMRAHGLDMASGGGTAIGDDMETQDLRNAQWYLGPNGEVISVERALKDLANRQVGYGNRIENTEAMTFGYGQRTENIERIVAAIAQKIDAVPAAVDALLRDDFEAVRKALPTPENLQAGITAALKGATVSSTVSPEDRAALATAAATAAEALLRPAFAAIPSAVNSDAAKRLQS